MHFHHFFLPFFFLPVDQPSTEFKYTKVASAIDFKKPQFHSSKERPELDPVLSALIGDDVKKSIDAKRSSEIDYVPTTDYPILTTYKNVRRNSAVDDSVVVDSIAGSSSDKKQVYLSLAHPSANCDKK